VQLTVDLTEIFETALSVGLPAGLPEPWRALLNRYQVPPDVEDDEDRYALAERRGLARGAAPGEVKHCVDVVVARFVAAKEALGRNPASVATAAQQLVHDAEETYVGYATHRLNSVSIEPPMTAHPRKRSWMRPHAGYVVGCHVCGGPRFDEAAACGSCSAHATE
jgi:hypothetical protein